MIDVVWAADSWYKWRKVHVRVSLYSDGGLSRKSLCGKVPGGGWRETDDLPHCGRCEAELNRYLEARLKIYGIGPTRREAICRAWLKATVAE